MHTSWTEYTQPAALTAGAVSRYESGSDDALSETAIMEDDMKTEIKAVIKRLEALLDGKEVDGLRLGDPGLTLEWVIESIAEYKKLLKA